ncbi:MAG: NAD(P)/FAD-dependent oxidoreductase [Chloroflexota bacterium]|jgi:phytoene dehydrogenase-like protein
MTTDHQDYNAIIIGAGHNGLVAAAYLAKRGKKVLVLERREVPGGTVVTESFDDGSAYDPVWTGGMLRPDIVKDLKLASHGLQVDSARKPFISLQADSPHLVIDADPLRAAEAIKPFSEKDAARWGEFVRFMNKAAYILDVAYDTLMPRLPRDFNLREGYGLLELGLELRLAGRKDMLNFIRALPMTAQELAEEYFESETVRAAVASLAVHAVTLGPMEAGTGYTLIHNWLNRGGLSLTPNPSPSGRGEAGARGIGAITFALANAVKSFGGEIRTGAEVKRILVDTYTCKGVALANGEEIFADAVISAVDPKRTFLELVGAPNLPPEFVWQVQSIKMRGSVAKVHLLTDGGHGIPDGTLVVAPSIKYLEKAYDAAKYGEISEKPYLEVTTMGKVVSIHFQYAPYHLKHDTWDLKRETVGKLAIDTLAEYFPNLQSLITNYRIITPLDLETTYGLTEGDLNHGQLMLDQFLFMRPIPGWLNHKTPIDNLYLCGSGVHGGGGVSGAAGRNLLKVLK